MTLANMFCPREHRGDKQRDGFRKEMRVSKRSGLFCLLSCIK